MNSLELQIGDIYFKKEGFELLTLLSELILKLQKKIN